MSKDYDIFVDAKGLQCPQPLLLVKHSIKQMANDQVLLLEATDPHTDLDLEVWCERFGHQIIDTLQQEDSYKFWIRKSVNSTQ
jgi:tRNA 2-thiouridine synthesizing protein A